MNPNSDIPVRDDIKGEDIPFEVLKYVPRDSAVYYQFVPIDFRDGVLEVGMVDPANLEARDALQFITSKNEVPFKIFQIPKNIFDDAVKNYEDLSSQVDKALNELQTDIKEEEKIIATNKEKVDKANVLKPSIIEEAPVTKIVAVILQHATSGNASDIHIEPMAEKVKVRFRVDGVLYTSLFLPRSVHDAVVARIKILTNMKLDEKRKPQDGRFSAKIDGRKVDFRVSTLPTYFGEKVVLRILDPDKKLVSLDAIGLSPEQKAIVQKGLDKPYGLILLTGPTGSGKTTTLYSMLSSMDREKYNAVSLEDPIEYDIPGVNQSQVQPEIKYTFANGLRTIMRQDPDIIMVGEIRDRETARLAIQAALTGHLVLSTLHTNSAIGVVPRLIDMGIDPYLIPPTLIMAIGQRLVPIICPDAKDPFPVEESIKIMLDKQLESLPPEFRSKFVIPKEVYHAKPTMTCPSGVKGRLGVFEILEMDSELEKIILRSGGETEIFDYARSKGFTTMREDAMLKAFQGITPFEEVSKL
ncbi:MAG: GspE/PulE family protein [bacterium]